MVRVRFFLLRLVWLVALAGLIAPPGLTLHALAAPAGEVAQVDCPDHAPPPDPCPAEGTAKHAASTCCPMMAGVVAVLPPAAISGASVPPAAPGTRLARTLSGRILSTDPPPPRL